MDVRAHAHTHTQINIWSDRNKNRGEREIKIEAKEFFPWDDGKEAKGGFTDLYDVSLLVGLGQPR